MDGATVMALAEQVRMLTEQLRSSQAVQPNNALSNNTPISVDQVSNGRSSQELDWPVNTLSNPIHNSTVYAHTQTQSVPAFGGSHVPIGRSSLGHATIPEVDRMPVQPDTIPYSQFFRPYGGTGNFLNSALGLSGNDSRPLAHSGISFNSLSPPSATFIPSFSFANLKSIDRPFHRSHKPIRRRSPERLFRSKRYWERRKFMRSLVLSSILGSETGDRRLYAEVLVNDAPYRGLLDSGANVSVLGCGSEKFMSHPFRNFRSLPTLIRTASGQIQRVFGYVVARVRFKGLTKCLNLYLVPSLEKELYLGMDFWNCFHISSDVPEIPRGHT